MIAREIMNMLCGGAGGGGEHYTSMPFTAELAGLFEPDSIDIINSLWRNKITGGNNMQLVGGAISDDALKFTAGQYGHVDAAYPYTYYLVVKKPVLETNKALFGSSNSNADRPSINCWNNGNSRGSMFECVSEDILSYYYTEELQKYHVLSCTVIINNVENIAQSLVNSANLLWIADSDAFCTPFRADITEMRAYTSWNGSIGLNCNAKGSSGNINYSNSACQQNSYIRAFAFGGRQTFEQMQANHKYLRERYCT